MDDGTRRIIQKSDFRADFLRAGPLPPVRMSPSGDKKCAQNNVKCRARGRSVRENRPGKTNVRARFTLMHSRNPVESGVAHPAFPPSATIPPTRPRSLALPPAGGILLATVVMLTLVACTTVVEPPALPAPPEQETQLLNALGSNWSEVIESAQYLSRHRTTEPGEIAALMRALEVKGDREFVLREAAARALGLAGDLEAGPSLIRRLEEDPDEDVRKAAAQALGVLRATAAVPTLLARVLDQTENHGVTAESAAALGEIGDPSVIGALERFRTEYADFWMENAALDAALAKLRAGVTK